jgi:two-component system, chemotaxis family, response regulator Rcp1
MTMAIATPAPSEPAGSDYKRPHAGDQAAVENVAPREPIEILVVEHDAHLTEQALREGDISTTVNHARDGVQALAFLRREGAYREAPRPDLILLDLNLQRVDGSELLAQIKCDPDLRSIPVIVLTDAAAEVHVATVAHVLADGALSKPLDAEKFATTARMLAARNSRSATTAAAAAGTEPQVFADLAHELRTHLNPIIAFSEIMKLEIRGPLNSDYRDYARGIHLSALALSRIVFDILDRSEGELRRLPPG